ncbi:hypothetical protein ACLB2K_048197 [Fragaria x ananassa]
MLGSLWIEYPVLIKILSKGRAISRMRDSQGNGKRKDYKTWTAEESNVLLQLMVEGTKLGFRDINGVIRKTTVEAKLLPKLQEKLGKEITFSHYQSRVKWFKKQYTNSSQFMRHNSGFGWDPITKRFTVPDEVWANYLKSHPTHVHFQTETFPDYEDLKIVVGNGTATRMSIGLGDDTDATTYEVGENGSWEMGDIYDLVFDQDNHIFVQNENESSYQENLPSLSRQRTPGNNANAAPHSRAQDKRSRADYEQSSNSKGVATQAEVCGIMEKRESRDTECWIAIQETPGLIDEASFFALSFLNTKAKQDIFLKMSPDQLRTFSISNVK